MDNKQFDIFIKKLDEINQSIKSNEPRVWWICFWLFIIVIVLIMNN